MVWIIGSVVTFGVLGGVIYAAVRHRPVDTAPPATTPSVPDDTLARRVRRLEDELDDVSTQVTQLRDDVQYVMRQMEDRG